MIQEEYKPSEEFVPFPKIKRLSKEKVIITEKLDGTNAQIYISPELEIKAASRRRWITPEQDNYGFAEWVARNRDELIKLGPGRHFGEWYGHGIQRGYGLDEKRFALFNTPRWWNMYQAHLQGHSTDFPQVSNMQVVPLLQIVEGLEMKSVHSLMEGLEKNGSFAVPGYMNPEGVVMYLPETNTLYKKTLDNDDHKNQ